MITKRLLILLGLVISGSPSLTMSQIRENDASITALTVQCAVSSGFAAIDYEDYCRSLAKTLSLLSIAQQERVFGYVPMASGSQVPDSRKTEDLPTAISKDETDTSKNKRPGPNENASDVAKSNFLMDLVKKINTTIDGTGTGLAPIIAESTGLDLTGSAVKENLQQTKGRARGDDDDKD